MLGSAVHTETMHRSRVTRVVQANHPARLVALGGVHENNGVFKECSNLGKGPGLARSAAQPGEQRRAGLTVMRRAEASPGLSE